MIAANAHVRVVRGNLLPEDLHCRKQYVECEIPLVFKYDRQVENLVNDPSCPINHIRLMYGYVNTRISKRIDALDRFNDTESLQSPWESELKEAEADGEFKKL